MDILKQIELTKDPNEAESLRQELLKEFFDSIEDDTMRLRMQQYQFRIDGILRKYKDPVARMNKIGAMMMESFYELNELLKEIK